MRTLSEIVDEFMLEREQDSPDRFPYFMQLGVQFIKQAHREATGAIKTTKIPVNANGVAYLPNGAVKVAMIYAIDRYGCVVAMSYNDAIRKHVDDCGDLVSCSGTVPYDVYWANLGSPLGDNVHVKNGYNYGAYYGIGGGSVAGGYRITNGRIELASTIACTHVVVDYIGLPEQVGNDYEVHPYYEEALKDYIDFKSVVRKTGVPLAVVADKEARFGHSLLRANMNFFGLTKDQIWDESLKNFTPTPKVY